MTPKQALERALAGSQSPTPQPITDEFALAIARKLEARGIAKVPGIPDDEERWQDTVLTFLQEQRDIEERAAERQAKAEAQHLPFSGSANDFVSHESLLTSLGNIGQ